MPTITNTEARLIWGPAVPGHKPPQWLPGKNRLDPVYWKAAKLNRDVKRWIDLGWLKVDETEDMPDPTVPPSPAELAEFSDKELHAALKPSSNVPVQWHPALEAEIAKRDSAAKATVAKNLPPKTPPTGPRKSLSGLKVDEAKALIAAETDVYTLDAWADADKRKSIDEAIDARLADLALDGEG